MTTAFNRTGMYVLDGTTPVPEPDLNKWGDWCEHANRVVQQDKVGNVFLSTVFLGIDHGWHEGPPVLFETMIFGGPRDQEAHRYCTWDEAEAGHKQILEELNAHQEH